MELLPCDCLKTICNFIKDKDYINFVSSSKYFHSLIKYNLKIIKEQYKLSKIIEVKDIYVFTNILYDFMIFEPTQIPHTITEITFRHNFDQPIDELCEYQYLTKINIGMYYSDSKLLYDNFSGKINKKELVMTIITNRVFASLFNLDTRNLCNLLNANNCFLRKFKEIYSEYHDRYTGFQYYIKKVEDIWGLNDSWMIPINRCINIENEYELCYFKRDPLELINKGDFIDYLNFLKWHIDKILEYFVKLKNIMCDKYENNKKLKC